MSDLSMLRSPIGTRPATAWALLIIAAAGGCVPAVNPPVPDGGTGQTVDGNVNPDPSLVDGKHISGEPDDTFAEAIDVILNSSGIGHIQGSISPAKDMDIFNLGPMSPGDRIRVDLQGGAGLDADIAIFDASDRLFIENDDRASTDLNPFVNEVVRHDGGSYYLAVIASPLASPGTDTGTYTAIITVGRGEPVPPPLPQPVLLDFAGGTIVVPDIGTVTVGPFNAGEISTAYAGQTTAIIQSIIDTVERDYTGIALQVFDTQTNPAPTGLAVSTIFFGARNANAFGISQEVDPYNHDRTDSSIIFTDDFGPVFFGRLLTVQELGEAIGNVAAHEIGHLVGLNHVDNTSDIMDTTGGPATLVANQTFQVSPLDALIFAMGLQDEPLLLEEILGPSP